MCCLPVEPPRALTRPRAYSGWRCALDRASRLSPSRRSRGKQRGSQRVLLEPPGSRRMSSQSLLNLRVSRPFAVGGVGRIELLVDVLAWMIDHGSDVHQGGDGPLMRAARPWTKAAVVARPRGRYPA